MKLPKLAKKMEEHASVLAGCACDLGCWTEGHSLDDLHDAEDRLEQALAEGLDLLHKLRVARR